MNISEFIDELEHKIKLLDSLRVNAYHESGYLSKGMSEKVSLDCEVLIQALSSALKNHDGGIV